MSVDYHLTLAATVVPEDMLERLAPALPRPLPEPHRFDRGMSLALQETCGFTLFLGTPQGDGYAGGLTDDGEWSWEPPEATTVSFGVSGDDMQRTVGNVFRVVARVLATGDEDLALTFGFDRLYLLRRDGVTVKHFREAFWTAYPDLGSIVPG